MKLNKYIDHTLLKANATKTEIDQLIKEAIENDFKAVCVNPFWVNYCQNALVSSDVLTCTVIGFPLGANTTESKVFETKDAIAAGAQEIDMVVNIGAIYNGDFDYVEKEIKAIKEACGKITLKVILEMCLLNEEQKRLACLACVNAKADFVKTSTGFSTHGATVADVKLMKEVVKEHCLIKAAGGVRSFSDLEEMIAAGANRIGTSAGVKLMKSEISDSNY